jgi:hypothetical protein
MDAGEHPAQRFPVREPIKKPNKLNREEHTVRTDTVRCLWHFVTPSHLIAATILFFLPWIEVRCNYTQTDASHTKGDDLLITQSGFQAACGTYTEKVPSSPFRPPDPNQHLLQQTPAPNLLLLVYGLLLIVAIAVSVVLRHGHLRSALTVLCSGAAFLVLLVQAQRGFSIENSLPIENAALKEHFESKRSMLIEGTPVLSVNFTSWYYASFFFPPLAVVTALLEWRLSDRKKPLVANDRGPPTESGPGANAG